MADFDSMAQQFTGGDVKPRKFDHGGGVMDMPTYGGKGGTEVMQSNASDEGAGASFKAASKRLADEAKAAAAASLMVERGILIGRLSDGTYNNGDPTALAGALTRLAVINAGFDVAPDYTGDVQTGGSGK